MEEEGEREGEAVGVTEDDTEPDMEGLPLGDPDEEPPPTPQPPAVREPQLDGESVALGLRVSDTIEVSVRALEALRDRVVERDGEVNAE